MPFCDESGRPNPGSPTWSEGWHARAHRLDSPNFGARPEGACIDLIVVHSISLPPGVYGGDAVQRFFTNQLDPAEHAYFEGIRDLKVSAHFFITRGGQLWQFVSTLDRAWHAGQSRYRGRDQCNDDSVGIELEGLEGRTFESAQYQTLVDLCQDLAHLHPIAHVAGHEHVAPGRKQDPGPGFDWAQFQRMLRWDHRYFP